MEERGRTDPLLVLHRFLASARKIDRDDPYRQLILLEYLKQRPAIADRLEVLF
jgi:hypothetical protein